LSRKYLDLRGRVTLVKMDVRGFDGELAAVPHRVARIDGKVQNGHFQLVGIGVGSPQPSREDRLYGDLLPKGPAQ
jgi:hypothetical protein